MHLAMRLEQIMTASVHSIEPDVDIALAKERMKRLGIRHLVVMRGPEIIGIISDRDVRRGRLTMSDDPWTVGDVMTPQVVVGSPEMTVRRAATLMRGRVVGCLPVVDGKRLVGIVTTADLLDLIARGIRGRTAEPKRRDSNGHGTART
jgi:acetoin utilization protein AcuB